MTDKDKVINYLKNKNEKLQIIAKEQEDEIYRLIEIIESYEMMARQNKSIQLEDL